MALIRLRVCAGWSEPLLVVHTTLLEISCRGSFVQLAENLSCKPDLDFRYLYPFERILSNIPIPICVKKNKIEQSHALNKWCQCYVKEMSSCYVATWHIQELLKALFNIRIWSLLVSKKKIHYLCEDGIEKSVSCDHRLSSLCKNSK